MACGLGSVVLAQPDRNTIIAIAAMPAQNCFDILKDKACAFTAGGMMVNNEGWHGLRTALNYLKAKEIR